MRILRLIYGVTTARQDKKCQHQTDAGYRTAHSVERKKPTEMVWLYKKTTTDYKNRE